ncbi:MAG: NUDIX domain-containing protein [Candidatus Nealsonbacteria bacterium]|nr:NUDIX domain-containing protein [Candidatus Nealsonbacteria bacterium]
MAINSFNYCPYDRAALQKLDAATAQCSECGFVDYGNPKPCVAVVIRRGGQILLGRRGVEPAKGKWDFLGGFIEANETAEQAVVREIREETGIEVRVVEYLGSFPDVYGPRCDPTLNLCFAAEPTTSHVAEASSDVAQLKWFDLDEAAGKLAFDFEEKLLRQLGAANSPVD